MYYIILYFICQEVFWNFLTGVWFLWVETNASKTKNRYKLAYPSCLLKKDIEVNSLSLLSEHWFAIQQASSLFLELSNNAQQTITSDGEWQTRTVSSLFFKQISYAIIASIPHIECDFNTGSGGHLLSDPGGARCQNRTALLVPKTRVLPLHFILHITRPKLESNQRPQIKCPPCTKRRSIVTMVLYH